MGGPRAPKQTNNQEAQKAVAISKKLYTINPTNFIPLYDNFYLTDAISRASITMGKCSNLFKTHNFDF